MQLIAGSLSRVAQLPESQEQVVHQGSVAAMLTLLRRDVSKPDEATWQSQASFGNLLLLVPSPWTMALSRHQATDFTPY